MIVRAPFSVVGYHGCSRETADAILGGAPFAPSANAMDWLGRGIYFWEFGPYRALEWAKEYHAEPAVLEAKIELGICLNLLDREHFDGLASVYQAVAEEYQDLDLPLPANTQRGAHFLDRLVNRYLLRTLLGPNSRVPDCARLFSGR